MIEYSTEIEIGEPVGVVWRRLIAFGSYPDWNPYQTITGAAWTGAKIRVNTRWRIDGKTVTSSARITRLEPEVNFEYRSGWAGFSARRWFVLEPTVRGVRVRHGIAFAGFVARWAFRDQLRIERLAPYYRALGEALAGKSRPAPTGPGNRRSRRQRRRNT